MVRRNLGSATPPSVMALFFLFSKMHYFSADLIPVRASHTRGNNSQLEPGQIQEHQVSHMTGNLNNREKSQLMRFFGNIENKQSRVSVY